MNDYTQAHNPHIERFRRYLRNSTRLDAKLPLIYWLTNQQLEDLLGISTATRKRDAALLRALGVINPSYCHRRGYNREAIEVFWEFRQLQQQFDRDEAVNSISTIMEILNHASERQRTA